MKKYIFLLVIYACAANSVFAEEKVRTSVDKQDFDLKDIKAPQNFTAVVLDPMKALEQSKEYRAGLEHIEKDFRAQQQEIVDIDRQIAQARSELEMAYSTLNDAGKKQRLEKINELQFKSESKKQTVHQYAQSAAEELRTKALLKIRDIAENIRKQLDVDAVLINVLCARDSIDITERVVTELNNNYEKTQSPKNIEQKIETPKQKAAIEK